ncbi:hypothetical protein JCM5353_000010 [Sporobolomyces roseus]
MSVLYLPTETLLVILELSLPSWPFSSFAQSVKRYHNLCLFTHVHSTWLPIARSLMNRYLFFNHDWPIKRYLRSTIRRQNLEATRILGITLGPGVQSDQVLGVLKPYQRARLNYLEAAEPLSWSTFEALRHLESLTTNYAPPPEYAPRPSGPQWQQLRSETLLRLVLYGYGTLTSPTTDVPLFTKESLPALRHLSISLVTSFVPRSAISSMLLPQLETLALAVSRMKYQYQSKPLFQRLQDGNNLRHLSLYLDWYDLHSSLFDQTTGLNLESLHLRSSAVLEWSKHSQASHWKYEGVGWDRLASSESETFQVKRVVCYGDAVDTSHLFVSPEDAEMFEWRTDRDMPPFKDFDGC